MKLILAMFGKIFQFLFKAKLFTSYGLSGIWLIVNFFVNWSKLGITVATKEVIKAVGGAELVIRDNVLLAVQNPEQYGFMNFLEILASFMIIITVIKAVGWVLIHVTASQSDAMAYVIATVLFVPLMTFASGVMLEGEYFIPVYDSVIFLFVNIEPVLTGVLPNWIINTAKDPMYLNNTISNSLNSTVANSTNISG